MSSADKNAGVSTVLQSLDDFVAYLSRRKHHSAVLRVACSEAAKRLEHIADNVRAEMQATGAQEAGAQFLETLELGAGTPSEQARAGCPQLTRLADPGYLPALLTLPRAGQGGYHYLLPVIAAWGFLGWAEWQYAREPRDLSLFGWWAQQGVLGPATYSGGVAVLLLILLVGQAITNRRVRLITETADRIAEESAVIAVAAAEALRPPARRRAANPIRALDATVGRLATVVEKLPELATPINQQSDALREYADAIAEMRTLLSEITPALGLLSSGTSETAAAATRIAAASDGLKERISETVEVMTSANQVLVSLDNLGTQMTAAADQQTTLLEGIQQSTVLRESIMDTQTKQLAESAAVVKGLDPMITSVNQMLTEMKQTTAELHAAATALGKPAQHLALALATLDGDPDGCRPDGDGSAGHGPNGRTASHAASH